MATLNLGRIKPVFQGAYNNSTAYVVDDIVTFGDESFICIQASTGNATSNASYWTKLAAKGADGSNGTDLTSTLSTQGDIVYRDGSGLARLGAGTSGQFLKTQGSGANPVWANNTAGVIQTVRYGTGSNWQQSMSGSSFTQINNGAVDFDVTITPSSASNSILIFGMLNVQRHPSASNYAGSVKVVRAISGGTTNALDIGNTHGSRPRGTFWTATGAPGYEPVHTFTLCDKSHNTTSAITYKLELIAHGDHTITFNYHPNHGDGNNGYKSQVFSTIMAQELGHTIADA